MYSTDLSAAEDAHAARAPVRRTCFVAPRWWGFFGPRLLEAGAWVVLTLFTYVLLSFHNPLQPAVTTTEAVLVVVLLGLVAARAQAEPESLRRRRVRTTAHAGHICGQGFKDIRHRR